ncbi:M24 family metallopeptidase [Fictibacillus sp. NRS-1165]|uniref:M24 family metallopeptidase n=1 Tax=Fictibacillus sp. NRS-1165 TaxID=3144463 RepID=UPI003D1CFF3D
MPAGERTAGARFSWTTEGKYQEGQLIYMELSGSYKRYHAPLTRTIFVGEPPHKVKETAKIVNRSVKRYTIHHQARSTV